MRPVAARRPGVEVHRSGAAKDYAGGRRRIGDLRPFTSALLSPKALATGAGAVVASGDHGAAQKVNTALEASQIAGGAGRGEGLKVVMDRLAEEAAPHRRRKQRAGTRSRPLPGRQANRRDRRLNGATIRLVRCRRSGRRACQGSKAEPQLPRKRLHHPIGGEFGPDDRKLDAGRQWVRRRRGWQ